MSLNGANRLGSNSLTECLVFGARAGRTAAEYADRAEAAGGAVSAQVRDEERRLRGLLESNGTERIASLRAEMQTAMEESAGIYRTGAKLTEGADTMGRLRQHARNLKLDDRSATFNTELVSALELEYMLELAEVILRSALERTESRGAHQRSDYPRAERRAVPGALAGLPRGGRLGAHRVSAGDHHALAAGRPRLRKVATKVATWRRQSS